jgi:hypothetical protein
VNKQKSVEDGFPKNKMRDDISLVALKGLFQLDTREKSRKKSMTREQ